MKKLIKYFFCFLTVSSFAQSATNSNYSHADADTLKRNKIFKQCVIQQDVVIQKLQTLNAIDDTMLVKLAKIEELVKKQKQQPKERGSLTF